MSRRRSTLNLQYTPDHYGASSDDEYALIKKQLEDTGLFNVNLQSTIYDEYSTERTKDATRCTSSDGSPTTPTPTTT